MEFIRQLTNLSTKIIGRVIFLIVFTFTFMVFASPNFIAIIKEKRLQHQKLIENRQIIEELRLAVKKDNQSGIPSSVEKKELINMNIYINAIIRGLSGKLTDEGKVPMEMGEAISESSAWISLDFYLTQYSAKLQTYYSTSGKTDKQFVDELINPVELNLQYVDETISSAFTKLSPDPIAEAMREGFLPHWIQTIRNDLIKLRGIELLDTSVQQLLNQRIKIVQDHYEEILQGINRSVRAVAVFEDDTGLKISSLSFFNFEKHLIKINKVISCAEVLMK